MYPLPSGHHSFPTPAAFFAALRGPADHDAHVVTRRHEMMLRANEAASARAAQAVRDECAAIIAESRARRASPSLRSAA
jgi:hypothetical protein